MGIIQPHPNPKKPYSIEWGFLFVMQNNKGHQTGKYGNPFRINILMNLYTKIVNFLYKVGSYKLFY